MSQNNETAAIVVYRQILWELNLYLMKKLPFVQIKLCEKKVYHLGIKMKTSITIVFILLTIPNSKLPVQM